MRRWRNPTWRYLPVVSQRIFQVTLVEIEKYQMNDGVEDIVVDLGKDLKAFTVKKVRSSKRAHIEKRLSRCSF